MNNITTYRDRFLSLLGGLSVLALAWILAF